jgi:hypothetical protein
MHPGPINRGVEIDPVVDGKQSVILPQVTFGIAAHGGDEHRGGNKHESPDPKAGCDPARNSTGLRLALRPGASLRQHAPSFSARPRTSMPRAASSRPAWSTWPRACASRARA